MSYEIGKLIKKHTFRGVIMRAFEKMVLVRGS